jgi:hypothetical protein
VGLCDVTVIGSGIPGILAQRDIAARDTFCDAFRLLDDSVVENDRLRTEAPPTATPGSEPILTAPEVLSI